jgi:hypothetical protein
MLFHFSFYWNEHPTLPAAGYQSAVEPGRHHLSPVKFPKSIIAPSAISVSGLFWRSLRLGLSAARANLVPACGVEAMMVGLVLAYFYASVTRPFFDLLSNWNVHGGVVFSFVAMGVAVSGSTELFIVYLHQRGRWSRENLVNLVFNFMVFGLLGVMNSGLYQLQAQWFGAGRSWETLVRKTLVDQFIYTPFLSNPCQTLAFLWKAEGFSFRSTVENLSDFKQFYLMTVLPVLTSNWCFWIPMSVLIYCFPTTLQLPLGILAVSIWSMLLAALVKPTDSAEGDVTSGSGESDQPKTMAN